MSEREREILSPYITRLAEARNSLAMAESLLRTMLELTEPSFNDPRVVFDSTAGTFTRLAD